MMSATLEDVNLYEDTIREYNGEIASPIVVSVVIGDMTY